MTVAIVRYNAGNTASVSNALRRLGVDAQIADDADEIRSAEKVIFPGVGEASTAMSYLRRLGLDRVLPSLTQPVLGICLGMQLLCESTEENDTLCLGILPARVRRLAPPGLKVPHTGWNRIQQLRSPLFAGLGADAWVYFVHGYYVEQGPMTTATVDHGGEFTAAFEAGNFYAVQFHPERSGPVGERILENFINL